jgi:hypothetical protein
MRRSLAATAAPFTLALAVCFALAHAACSSDGGTPTSAGDAGAPGDGDSSTPPTSADAGLDASAAIDAACPTTKTVPATGETCTGFGSSADTCDPVCGLPAYGYVCFNGGPPGLSGCVQVRSSSLGETYCCANNACVAEPDQDTQCAAVSGKPHLYQCPPDGTDGGTVAPAGGSACAAQVVAGSPYAYFCCP